MDLSKLLSLLQGAKEGSEYLDYAIQRALFPMAKPVPLFTRSLDGASLLIPAGWTIHRLSHLSNCRGGTSGWLADVYRPSDAVIPFPSDGIAPTAPLALSIAAVRARIGQRMNGEEPIRRIACE